MYGNRIFLFDKVRFTLYIYITKYGKRTFDCYYSSSS